MGIKGNQNPQYYFKGGQGKMRESMLKKSLIVMLALLACLTMIVTADAADKYKGYVHGDVFITAQELSSLIKAKDPKLVIIAVSHAGQYFTGHIPGSVRIWRPDYEADPKTQGGVTDNLLQPEGFSKLMQKLGVNADSKVVVYDYKYDATRIWWAFFYYGKTDVRVLDGGYKAWSSAGFETNLLAGKDPVPGTWVAKVSDPRMIVDTPEILKLKDRKDAQLWDNRGDPEFCGKEINKGAFRAGRIPWAVQADYVLVRNKKNDEWLTAAEVQANMKKLGFDPRKEQYFNCQSGVRTTQWIMTLYALGWPMKKLHNYDSSWIGWSKDDKLPIEKDCPDTTPAPWQKK
jgi:thiosulfate/3-mercaptopyruvate sulfurtransferase